MSLDVVRAVRAQYPAALTPEQCVRVSNEVAFRLNGQSTTGPWGLRAKSSGTQWGGVGLDVIVHRQNAVQWYGVDILVNAPDPASPAWQDQIPAPPEGWAAVWTPVRLDWLPGLPPPDPPPTGDVEARLAALEARVAVLEFRTSKAGAELAGL